MRIALSGILALLCFTACERRGPAVASDPEIPAPPVPAVVEEPAPAPLPEIAPPGDETLPVLDEHPSPAEETGSPTPGERLDHALDKAESGIRRAMEATGGGIRRLGETIERKADEHLQDGE